MFEEAEIEVRSKTQDAATIQRILEDDGFGEVVVDGVVVPPIEEEPVPAAATAVEAAPADQQVDDVDDDEPAAPVVEGQPPAPKKHRPGSKDRKITRLSTELETERTARLALEARLTELEKGKGSPAPTATPVTTEPVAAEDDPFKDIPALGAKPKYEDFADQDDPMTAFADARDSWKDEQIERDRLIREAKQKQEEGRKSKETAEQEASRNAELQAVEARIAPAKQKYSDYDAKVSAVTDCPTVLVETINKFSTMPGEVKYYLANHPEELEKIAKKVRGLTDKSSVAEVNHKIALSHAQLLILEEKLEAELQASQQVDDDMDDPDDGVADQVEEPVKPAPAAAVPPAPKPAEPRRNATPPTPKPASAPHNPVGGRRVAAPQKSISQMTPDELRDMPMEEYRAKMYPETVSR
jgi:uncharacterized cysteine cluster protein YcgN (CxxCxxCC family)